MESATTYEKKHILANNKSANQGYFIESSIWSLNDDDRESITAIGLLEVDIINARVYPTEFEIEAKGEGIRWETQKLTNKRMFIPPFNSNEKNNKFIQIFEIDELPIASTQLINNIDRESIQNHDQFQNSKSIKSAEIHKQQTDSDSYENLKSWKALKIIEISINIESLGSSFINQVIPLNFHVSGVSQLLYRSQDFEQSCSLIIPDFEIINNQLIKYLAQHPEYLHTLHWRKFEELLDALFRNLGYRTELGPGTGDEGIDLRLYQKDDISEVLTLVQAKKYDPKNPIALEPVQALSAVVNLENAQRGLFVTTSRYLPVARRFAEKVGRKLVLADTNDIVKWCKDSTKLGC